MLGGMEHSALYQLIEARLGQPLDGWLADRREDGDSYDAIAETLRHRTATTVSRDTVYRWINDPQAKAAS